MPQIDPLVPGLARIQFLGAARSVTGSCFLVEPLAADGRLSGPRLLVDCGLVQGASEMVRRNFLPFAFDPRTLDAVILTHAHLDHSGLVPRLLAEGFRGRILTTAITKDLLPVLWEDHLRIQTGDGNARRSRRAAVEPLLYTERDIDRALGRCEGHAYGRWIDLAPACRVRFSDAGHILGSAIVELAVGSRRLVFSGDLGHRGKPIVRDPSSIEHADVLVLESTYGDRNHKSLADTKQELGSVIAETLEAGGTVLMPTYAIGRSQDVLYMINELTLQGRLSRPRVYLDSPMAIRVAEVYAQHLEAFDEEAAALVRRPPKNPHAPLVMFTESAAASRAIARKRGVIVLAGSGMCEGGRIQDHLARHLDDPRCSVIFTGFQVAGTLGRRLVDGARQVSLQGRSISVRARIHTINGLSAHADQHGLLEWVGRFRRPYPRTFLVHGEPEKMARLADALTERYGIKAAMPAWQESVVS